MADQYHVEGVKGLTIALGSYEALLPGAGQYLLMLIVTIFAFSTMFSYSYYGPKCFGYLFGMHHMAVAAAVKKEAIPEAPDGCWWRKLW